MIVDRATCYTIRQYFDSSDSGGADADIRRRLQQAQRGMVKTTHVFFCFGLYLGDGDEVINGSAVVSDV